MKLFNQFKFWLDKQLALRAVKKAIEQIESNGGGFTCFALEDFSWSDVAIDAYWLKLFEINNGTTYYSSSTVTDKLYDLGYSAKYLEKVEMRLYMLSLLYVLIESGEFREITGFQGFYMFSSRD